MPSKDARKYYQENKERINAQRRERYRRDPDRVLRVNREYWLRSAEKLKHRRRVLKYKTDGLAMRQEQRGRCAICSVTLTSIIRRSNTAHLDHDHKTGEVRGWLCANCNTGLGLFKDNAQTLLQAVKYLARTPQ